MAITQATVRNDQLELQRRGFINVNLTALTTTAVPDVEVGSAFEVGGSIYEIDTADETPAGWSGIANDTQAYIYFDASAETLNFTDTAPSYSAAKGGWYSGDDRYLAKVYKNASSEAVQKEVYRQSSESADALQFFLDSLPTFSNRTVYSTAGSDTWVCPDDVRMVKVAIIGAGGGGGGAFANATGAEASGGGGGSGAVIVAYKSVLPGKEYSLTVGAGGAGGIGSTTPNVASEDGGDSVFDTFTSGGGGGANPPAAATGAGDTDYESGGAGAADPAVQYSVPGRDGENGSAGSGGDAARRGYHENSDHPFEPFHHGEDSAVVAGATNGNGSNGVNYGEGGSGAHSEDFEKYDGGDGADGAVIIAY